jgi:hypothetical protein
MTECFSKNVEFYGGGTPAVHCISPPYGTERKVLQSEVRNLAAGDCLWSRWKQQNTNFRGKTAVVLITTKIIHSIFFLFICWLTALRPIAKYAGVKNINKSIRNTKQIYTDRRLNRGNLYDDDGDNSSDTNKSCDLRSAKGEINKFILNKINI